MATTLLACLILSTVLMTLTFHASTLYAQIIGKLSPKEVMWN